MEVNKYKMRIAFISLIFSLVACSNLMMQPVAVIYGERDTLYFTGRGAAAGMMMDAYMGGAGVAIGIAIDEGIAKDISAALAANNPTFSMEGLVKNELQKNIRQGIKYGNIKTLTIEKYGFFSEPDDMVSPLLEFRFVCASGQQRVVKYSPDKNQYLTFDQAKTNGALVEAKLRYAVENILKLNSAVCVKQ